MEATVQLAMLENCLGSDGLKICNSLTFDTDQTNDTKTVIVKLKVLLFMWTSSVVHRYISISVIYQHCYLDCSYLHRFLFKVHY